MRRMRNLVFGLLFLSAGAALAAAPASADVRINEIRIDQPGTDNDEYVEFVGSPGESLAGLTYLVIGDGAAAAGSGVVEVVAHLTGSSVSASGFFVVAESTFTLGARDLTASLNFENSDNVTHLLVRGFTGTDGQDLDTNNDGVLDITPWTEVLDAVALVTAVAGDLVYASTVGPDGTFVPGHVFRLPDATGPWQMGAFAGGEDSPGAPNAVGAIHDATIPQIQGADHASDFDDLKVRTTGVVTAVRLNGFYLQDPTGDGNDVTSDGIFVFTGSAPTVTTGDAIEVQGVVQEFTPGGAGTGNLSLTEIVAPVITFGTGGQPLPAPVVLGAGGRVPPTLTIDDDGLATFDPASDGIDFYETLEGMRVTVPSPVVVGPSNRFRETWVLADGGAGATGRNARGGISILSNDFNPERIQVQLDAGLLPGFTLAANVGDTLGDVTGVVGYDFGNFQVEATAPFLHTPGGLAQETSALVPTTRGLTVATLNTLNLDPNDLDAPQNDADVADGQFERLAGIVVANLRSPDIVALQEIQDESGGTDDGTTSGALTLTMLAEAIVAAGGPSYEWIDNPPVDGQDGGQPGGNIRVAYLYNPARVSLLAGSVVRVLDSDLSDGDAFADARKPLLATFLFQGASFTLINNHLSSKGGGTPLFGQVQPPVNGSLSQRIAQAHVVRDVVDGLLAADATARVIVLGDLNEFAWESPVAILTGAGATALADLAGALQPPLERYSYIFEGNSQELDHVLVSAALTGVAEFDAVHVNAEFAGGASDHDPLLARFTLPEPPAVPTAQDVLDFVQEAARDGQLRGVRRNPLQVILFKLHLCLAVVAEQQGRWRAAEVLLECALKFVDGLPHPKDTLEGPAVGPLADLLRASLTRF